MNNGNCLDTLQARLKDAGVEYDVFEHPVAPTTSEAAAAESVSGYEFAKAVVLIADNVPQLHVLRAADQVGLDSVAATQRVHEVRVARDGEFEYLFPGCEHSPPPIPFNSNLHVRVDRRLLDNDRITFEAGDGTHSIRLRTDDYMRVVGGEVADFAEVQRGKGRQRPQGAPVEWSRWARRGLVAAGVVSSATVLRRPLMRLMRAPAGRSFMAGAVGGAVTSALADPRSGNRRRHLLWDRTGRLVRRANWWIGKQTRYWRGRSEGVRHELGDALSGS